MNEMQTAERMAYDTCCATKRQLGTDEIKGQKVVARVQVNSNVHTLVAPLSTVQFQQFLAASRLRSTYQRPHYSRFIHTR